MKKRKKAAKTFQGWRKRVKSKHLVSMEEFVNAEIARRDWISYINPAVDAQIERSLANAVLLATKGLKPEPNEMDILGNLACLHIQHGAALAEIRGDCKQLEILLVPPLSRPVFLFSDEGALYVCDTPLMPFVQDN